MDLRSPEPEKSVLREVAEAVGSVDAAGEPCSRCGSTEQVFRDAQKWRRDRDRRRRYMRERRKK